MAKAKSVKSVKISVILPPGTARFPNLWVPRRFEQPGKKPGELKYEVGCLYSAADMKKIDAIYKDAWEQFCACDDFDFEVDDFKSPFKKDKKDKSIKFLNAHSVAKYKPPIFDARLKPVTSEFGGGSIIALDVALKPYDGFGGGITTYINAVQLLKKEAAQSFSGPRFEQADGYSADEDEDAPATGSRFQAQEGHEEVAGEGDDHNF